MTNDKTIPAALSALAVLQGVMLAALFAGVQPHPPATIPLFGLAPFLALALALALAAIVTGPLNGLLGKGMTIGALLCALLSYGPQKYVDPAFPLIWPAVVGAQFFIVVATLSLWRGLKQH